jgi:hypothetical protein
MPCLSWRALVSLVAIASISRSMSERMVAIALISGLTIYKTKGFPIQETRDRHF